MGVDVPNWHLKKMKARSNQANPRNQHTPAGPIDSSDASGRTSRTKFEVTDCDLKLEPSRNCVAGKRHSTKFSGRSHQLPEEVCSYSLD